MNRRTDSNVYGYGLLEVFCCCGYRHRVGNVTDGPYISLAGFDWAITRPPDMLIERHGKASRGPCQSVDRHKNILVHMLQFCV